MKQLLTAVAFAALSSAASAGSLADPVIEAPIIVAEASSSSSGTVTVALLALLLIIPVISD